MKRAIRFVIDVELCMDSDANLAWPAACAALEKHIAALRASNGRDQARLEFVYPGDGGMAQRVQLEWHTEGPVDLMWDA